jgi:predicted secreted protein
MAFTKGQFVRLFLGNNNTDTPSRVVAAARQLSLHISVSLDTVTTKDTEGDWLVQEPTELNYDITSNALVRSGDTITSQVGAQTVAEIEDIFEAALPVQWMIANVSGANQRTKGATIVSGSVIVTSLVANGPNRQSADYTTTLTGIGDYVVAE